MRAKVVVGGAMLLALVGLAAAPSCGGNSAAGGAALQRQAPVEQAVALSAAASGGFSLQVLGDSFALGGTAQGVSLTLASDSGGKPGLSAGIAVAQAHGLRALYFDLHYDKARWHPLAAEPAAMLGAPEELLSLTRMDEPGVVHAGQVLIHPDRREGFSGDGVLYRVRFAPGPAQAALARQVSAPPTTSKSQAKLRWNAGAKQLEWGYYCQGDYGQNGVVGVSDLTPLGIHFGANSGGGPFPEDSIEAVVDGSGDGTINIADVAPIGLNFGKRVLSYNVFGSDNISDYPAANDAVSSLLPLGNVVFGSATGNPATGRLRFTYALAALDRTNFYWVRPADGADEGTPSLKLGGGGEGVWEHTWGGIQDDVFNAIECDSEGNVYAAGATYSSGEGGADMLILKLSPDGQVLWRQTWGGPQDDWALGISIDGLNSSLYVAGVTESYGTGGQDALLVKASLDGAVEWNRTYGGSGNDWAEDVACAPDGSISVVGSGDYSKTLLLRYLPTGDLIVRQYYNSSNGSPAWACAVDNDNNTYITCSNGYNGVRVLKYNATGDLLWQRTWDDDNNEKALGIATDGSGNVIVSGWTQSFGAGGKDVFALKYTADGNLAWQITWGSNEDESGEDVAVNGFGDILIAGYSNSFTTGTADVLLLGFAADGSQFLRKTWSAADETQANCLTVDPLGAVYIGGSATRNLGVWGDVNGTMSDPLDTATVPTNESLSSTLSEGAPVLKDHIPALVLDTGGGLQDALVLKFQPYLPSL